MGKATAANLIDRLLHSSVCFPCGVCSLHIHKTQHLSAWRQTTYEQSLLTNPSILLHHCNTWRPTTWLALWWGAPRSVPHDCLRLYIWSQTYRTISQTSFQKSRLTSIWWWLLQTKFPGTHNYSWCHCFPTWNTEEIFFAHCKNSPCGWTHGSY